MASIKVAQKVTSLTGTGSATIALKSGYIRVTPVGAVGVGATVEVTGCAPSGINTSLATVSAVTGPDPINGVQSGTVTLNYGDANLSATDAVGEIRRVVKVDVSQVGTNKVHITEVQNAGGF